MTELVLGHGPRRLTGVPGRTGWPLSLRVTRPWICPPPSWRFRFTLLTVFVAVIWLGFEVEGLPRPGLQQQRAPLGINSSKILGRQVLLESGPLLVEALLERQALLEPVGGPIDRQREPPQLPGRLRWIFDQQRFPGSP